GRRSPATRLPGHVEGRAYQPTPREIAIVKVTRPAVEFAAERRQTGQNVFGARAYRESIAVRPPDFPLVDLGWGDGLHRRGLRWTVQTGGHESATHREFVGGLATAPARPCLRLAGESD